MNSGKVVQNGIRYHTRTIVKSRIRSPVLVPPAVHILPLVGSFPVSVAVLIQISFAVGADAPSVRGMVVRLSVLRVRMLLLLLELVDVVG